MLGDDFSLFTNAAIVNAGIASTYNGKQGLCAWMKDLEQFDFSTLTTSFADLHDGRIVQILKWTPALKTGAKAPRATTDIAITKYRNGRLILLDYYFSEPEAIEKLFVNPTPTHAQNATESYQKWALGVSTPSWELRGNAWEHFQAWMKLRADWAEGKFSGTKCEKAISGRVSPSFTLVNVPYIKNIGLDEAYVGEEGYCKYVADLEQFDFSNEISTNFLINNEEFIMVNEYTPALKSAVAKSVLDQSLVLTSKDIAVVSWKHGLLQGFKYFYSAPDMWTSLFAATAK
jgi:hypothetical protein